MTTNNTLNYAVIAGSTQENSQSSKVANFIKQRLLANEKTNTVNIVDLAKSTLAIWPNQQSEVQWQPISEQLSIADAIVLITPEWNGMASPAIRNLFIYTELELAHKPGLIVSISSGINGSVPIAELRMNTYKNSRINYLPEHMIIRDVRNELESVDAENYLQQRLQYNLNLLREYAIGLQHVRQSNVIDHENYTYGM